MDVSGAFTNASPIPPLSIACSACSGCSSCCMRRPPVEERSVIGAFLAIHDVLRTHVDERCGRRTTSSVLEHACPKLSTSSHLSPRCHLHVIVLPPTLRHTLLGSETPAST